MNEARRERIGELIRSLEAVQLRRRARCDEDGAFEGRSSSSTESGAGKARKMQRMPRAKRGTTSRAPTIT